MSVADLLVWSCWRCAARRVHAFRLSSRLHPCVLSLWIVLVLNCISMPRAWCWLLAPAHLHLVAFVLRSFVTLLSLDGCADL